MKKTQDHGLYLCKDVDSHTKRANELGLSENYYNWLVGVQGTDTSELKTTRQRKSFEEITLTEDTADKLLLKPLKNLKNIFSPQR